MAKGKKTGGRAKGVLNKRTLLVDEIASRFELDPFEVLMMVAVGDWEALGFDSKTRVTVTSKGEAIEEDSVPLAQRVQAAKEAAKYLYAQKQSVAISTDDSGFKIIIEDYTKPKG